MLDDVNGTDVAAWSQQANAIAIGLSMLEILVNKSSIANDGSLIVP